MKPKISILIPAYKRNEYLICAIKSCLNQTQKPFEIIVKDDDPRSITFLPKLPKYFKYIKNKKNFGLIKNFLSLAKIAQGDYFVFLGDDDILMPNFIETWTKIISKNPQINIFTSPVLSFKGKKSIFLMQPFNKNKIINEDALKILWKKNIFGISTLTSATVYNKKFFNNLKINDYGNETDIELALRILVSKKPIYFYKDPLFFYRRSGSQQSNYQNKFKKTEAIIKNIEILKNYSNNKNYIWEKPLSFFLLTNLLNKKLTKKYKFKIKYIYYFLQICFSIIKQKILFNLKNKKYNKMLSKIDP